MAKQPVKKNNPPKQPAFWDQVTRVPVVFLLFFVVAFLIYGQVMNFYLGKFDEDALVLGNLEFLKDFSNIRLAFMKDVFLTDKIGSFYRPLQTVSFMIDAHFFHERGSVFYLTNILLHASACCALFYLLQMLVNDRKGAFIITLLYLASPLFVQAIAWAPSRGDLLIGLAGLLSMIFYLKLKATRDYKYAAFALAVFAVALFSKETAVLIPVVVVLYEIIAGKDKKLTRTMLLTLACGTLLIMLLFFYLRSQAVRMSTPALEFGIIPFFNNLRTLPEYIGKFFIPVHLSPMPGFTLFSTAMGMILLACLAWAWWHFSRKSAAALFGFAWFLVFALPGVMYSHTLGSAAYDYLEHRAYLPMAGIMVLLLFIYNDIPGGKIKNRVANSALFFAFFLGIWSFIYAGNYENPMTFYNQAVASNPASALALDNRGLIRADTKDFRGALEDYDKALSVKHDYAQAYVNKGIALSALNDKQGALVQYDAAIKIKPDLFQAHFNKANTKTGLGLLDEALAEYTLALGISPGYAPGYMARSSVYFNLKNYPAAEQDLTRVLQLDQRNAAAWLNRGKIRYYENNRKGSCDDWTMAASLGEPNAPKLLESYCR